MPGDQWRLVQQRLHRERALEERQDDLRVMLKEQNLQAVHGECAAHVEAMRRHRMEAAERQELLDDYIYVKSEQEKENRRQISEFEERLAQELAKRKAQQVRKQVVRQQVCNGSEELRALKEKLRAAQVNKVRAKQMLEKQERERVEMEQQGVLDALVEERRAEAELDERRQQKQKALAKAAFLKENQDLIAQKEIEREEAMREFEKDKAAVEEVMSKVVEEDWRDLVAREHKKKEMNRILAEYKQAAEDRRRDDEQEQVEEERRIEAYNKKKRLHEQELAKEKRQLDDERQRILQELSSQHEKRNREAQEMERLREDLWREEREEAERRKDLMKARKRLEDQQEMLREYQAYLEKQESRRRQEAAQAEAQKQDLMEQYAEDKRLDQLSAQKRRLKMQEYRREVDKQMQDQQERYDRERKQELEELARMRAEEAERARMVEEERQRLLREHAGDVRHFPKGALTRESDLDLVGLPRTDPAGGSDQSVVRRQRDNYIGLSPYPANLRAASAKGARSAPVQDALPEADPDQEELLAAPMARPPARSPHTSSARFSPAPRMPQARHTGGVAAIFGGDDGSRFQPPVRQPQTRPRSSSAAATTRRSS